MSQPLGDDHAPTQNDQLAQRNVLLHVERETLAFELELLRLKHAQPPLSPLIDTDTGTFAAAATMKNAMQCYRIKMQARMCSIKLLIRY